MVHMKEMAAIEIEDLSVGYGPEPIIKDVDLRVEEGEFFGIIGPNGGGKTTLFKAILGLLKPMKGHIRIYGEPPRTGSQYIGYVPQYAEYDKDYPISVREVVLMGRRSKRGFFLRYSKEDKAAASEALGSVGMLDNEGEPLSDLSGGQRQRVFIARALAARPRILLLDEPTASVDPRIQESIYALLSELNERMTIVLVTHDVGIISSHVKSVGCLNRFMFTHEEKLLTKEMLEASYQCPVDLISHGTPHRVFELHGDHHHHHGGERN